MEFIDTHTHLYDEAYGGIQGQDEAVRRAIDASVRMMIIPDTSTKDRPAVLELCERWKENTRACIGLHPTELGPDYKAELLALEKDLSAGHNIVAIGEAGLDLHWDKETLPAQEEVFRVQLDFALQMKLPLIVHCREASDQCFKILEDYKGRGLRGVFHAFSGSIETYRRLERYGDWYVGIGGVLTFKKASIAETVREIPLERILLETDSPYLCPAPHRGERNESSYIPLIADFLAQRKQTSLEEVADTTTKNAKLLFQL